MILRTWCLPFEDRHALSLFPISLRDRISGRLYLLICTLGVRIARAQVDSTILARWCFGIWR